MDSFLSSEYASLDQLYVNTAVRGLLPARTVAKLTEMGKVLTTPDFDWRTANDEDAATIRQSFAALCGEDSGVKAEDVVIAASGASASALLARNLMVDGTVVVGLSNDFSSLIAPIVGTLGFAAGIRAMMRAYRELNARALGNLSEPEAPTDGTGNE